MFRLGEKIVDILNLLPHSGPNLPSLSRNIMQQPKIKTREITKHNNNDNNNNSSLVVVSSASPIPNEAYYGCAFYYSGISYIFWLSQYICASEVRTCIQIHKYKTVFLTISDSE
jgi:hypothetical protein